MIEVEKDLWRSSGPTLPLKQGHLEMKKYEMQSVTVVVGLLTTGNDKYPAKLHWLILCTQPVNQSEGLNNN